MTRRLLAVVTLLASVALAAGLWSASRLFAPARGEGEPQVFTVGEGEPLISVLRRLDDEGLLAHAPLFGPRVVGLWARVTGADRQVKSGEYDLDPRWSATEVLAHLVSGSIKTYPVTLPEGLRMDEIAARLSATGLVDGNAVLARATEPAFVRALGIEADTLEGYLYPETYRFRRNEAPDEVLRRMVGEFRGRLAAEDRAALEESGFTLHEAVTLASIVEKETAVADERGLVAAVFRNRLERGMRLQSDPTVIYGVIQARGAFDGNIRTRDLREDNPYNTYTRGGLPPGPIASVTIESLRAVLLPADVPYLYFVSRNDGTHVFSQTLREHSRAVDEYQRRRRGDPS